MTPPKPGHRPESVFRRALRRPLLFLVPLFALLGMALFTPAWSAETSTGGDPHAASASPSASGRKGVSARPADGVSQAITDVGASWYYNWSSSTGDIAKPDGAEFVPMIWGRDNVDSGDLDAAKKEGKELLGFNEPDLDGQAKMSVDEALEKWPQLEKTGLRLGAPAVASGADKEGGWLDQFMKGAEQRGYKVDFIPLHWYGGDFGSAAAGQLRDYVQAVHDRYHKPVWVTEFALTDFSGGTPRYPSAQQQADFVRSATKMLDGLSYVERYAWFSLSTETSPTGLYTGTRPNSSGTAYRDAS